MSITSFATAQLIRALPRVQLSRVVGRLCDQPLPTAVSRVVQRAYCAAYSVDMEEAESPGPYPSFDAFFTRALRHGVRPIAQASVVSPSDGLLSARGAVDAVGRITVKRQRYDVAELVGDASDGERYRSGQFAVVYLAPRDYHRVHSPVDGKVALVRGIPGDLYPVNAIGERYVDGLFVRNNRVCVCIDTPKLGRVSVVLVGATIVGRISVSMIAEPFVAPGPQVIEPAAVLSRGQELGRFHLGSTAVVLVEPGPTIARQEGVVRMGESLLEGPS